MKSKQARFLQISKRWMGCKSSFYKRGVVTMKKTFNLIYYIVFVAGLWGLNRHFRNFVAVNGVLQGLFVGLVLAFLAKLIFKTITKVLLFLIVIVGILVFLFSIDFFTLPEWAYNIWGMVLTIRGGLDI